MCHVQSCDDEKSIPYWIQEHVQGECYFGVLGILSEHTLAGDNNGGIQATFVGLVWVVPELMDFFNQYPANKYFWKPFIMATEKVFPSKPEQSHSTFRHKTTLTCTCLDGQNVQTCVSVL